MALIQCKECGASVSDGAAVCPHCGVGLPALSTPEKTAMLADLKRAQYGRLGGLAFFIGVAWLFFLMVTDAGPDAVGAAWRFAKYLIVGGALAYVVAEIERNLRIKRKQKT